MADALDSGSSGGNPVEVQVLSAAYKIEKSDLLLQIAFFVSQKNEGQPADWPSYLDTEVNVTLLLFSVCMNAER
jgi:hypothetical protein